MVEAAKKTLRIDSDSHFLPLLDPESLAALLPGFEPRLVDMIARDTAVFSDPNARSGGFSGTAAGQQVGALVGGISARGGNSGPVGHAAFEERAKLLPETGFDMQVLIPDGVFLERPFKSPRRRGRVRHRLVHPIRPLCRVQQRRRRRPEQYGRYLHRRSAGPLRRGLRRTVLR